MIRILMPLACLSLLAACSPEPQVPVAVEPQVQSDSPAPAAPPHVDPIPAAPAATDSRLRAFGTEPFWAVDVHGSRLLYMTPDMPDGVALAATETPFARGTTWTGTHAGQPFSLTIREDDAGACNDGMSDREYQYHADFDIAGEELYGCGEDVDDELLD